MSRTAIPSLVLALAILFGVAPTPTAESALLNEPTTPILDTFTGRGLEDPLHQWGNWEPRSIDGTGQTLEVIGNAAGHNEGQGTVGDSYRSADLPAGDAEVYATIAASPNNNRIMSLYLDLQEAGTPGVDGYELRWFHWISVDGLYIRKIVDGVSASLVPPLQIDPATGDTLLLRRVGSSLQLWHKSAGTWTLRLSANDSAYQGGRLGLGTDDDRGRWDDFGGTGSTTPPPAQLPLPATSVLDAFGRADEDPLSQAGAWSPSPVAGSGETLEVLSQTAGQNEGTVVQANSFRAEETSGDVEVYARIAAMPDNNQESYLYLDLQEAGTPAVDGYRMRWFHWIVADELTIQKIVDGVPSTLVGPIGLDPAVGDTLLLRRLGTALELWRKNGDAWAKLLTTADAAFTSGKLGLGLDDQAGRWDDFGGGEIDAPPPPPPPPPPSDDPPPEQSRGICTGSGLHAIATSRCLSDPVNTLTGALVTSVEDLSVPGTGVGLVWGRSYTSSDPTVGRLGPGWTDGYAVSLAIQPSGDVVLHGDEGQLVSYVKQPDGSFVGAPGALSTLSAVTEGYELVRTDQVAYRFDARGRLVSVEDRNGRGLTFTYDGTGRLTTITDAAGRAATISYDAEGLVSQVESEDSRSVGYGYTDGRLTSVTDVRGETWRYTYDAQGRLATIVDPLDRAQVTNVYDGGGRVQTQTDALGNTTTFAWDPATQTATITDANGNTWTDDYDENVLTERTDPLGNATGFDHDSDLNTSAVVAPTGEQTSMMHDPRGNLLVATAPASLGGVRKTFVYNGRNDPTQITDARGAVTSYTYDADGNTQSVVQAGTEVAAYTHDGAGRVLTSTDGDSQTTTYTYDADGNVASETDPLGSTTAYTHDAAGRVLTRVDPKGNVPGANPADFTWRWTYDEAGRVLTERDPLGNTTSHTYDRAGNELTVTDASGRTTSYAYDSANRLVAETGPDPDGTGPQTAPVTRYTYDDVGNRLTETDPLGRTTTFAFDPANRLVSTTGPDPDAGGPVAAPVTTNTHDANGNLASVVEPRGNVQGANPDEYRTRYMYDAAGRLLTTTDPLGNSITNTYDAVGNVESVRDANGHTTSYTYDTSGRILTVTGADGGVTAFTYDAAGNRLTRRDANDHVRSWSYDGVGRVSSETLPDPDGPGPKGPPVTTHTYDVNGNLATTVDANGTATPTQGDGAATFGYDRVNRLTSIDYSDTTPDVTFAYDAVGNRTSMTDGSGTETRSYDGLDRLLSVARSSNTFAYTYDAVGNVLQRTYPGGTVTDYGYDGIDRLATATSGGRSTSFGYDAASNLVRTTLPPGNGYVESRAYDRAGRLTEVTSQKGTTVLARLVATLDAVGNPTQIVRTGALAQTQTYTYDPNDRLASVCFQAGICPGTSDPFIRWVYDKVGNRLAEHRPSGTWTYTYDAADRLMQVGSTSYSYDQNGNELSAGSRTFTYDLANRMKTTRLGSTTTTYSYDGDGVRVQSSTGSSSSRKTNFFWDVNHALPQVALERNGSGSTLRGYTYGARRISMTASSNTSYYHYDGLGSVVNMTSSSGSRRGTWSYEPFGSIRTEQRSGGSAPTNFMKFAGEYLDPTGLYHLRARQYDPVTGRFTQPDPMELERRTPHIAEYVYVANRPVILVDPSGETFQPSSDAVDAVGRATSPEDVLAPTPPIPGGFGGGCAARAGYPLGVIGGFNGGPYAGTHTRGNWQSDNAIDLNVPIGTRVCAIIGGRISPTLGFGRSSEGYRLHLVGATDTAFYQHLSRIIVKRAQPIQKGQLLGFSGCGSERVPHLHLALMRGNPLRYAPPYRKPISHGGC